MKNWITGLFKTYFFSLFPYIVVFTASLYAPSDSDLGWHLKYGEYFFKNGSILRENIFSTMMSGFRWINSSWATDLLSYATFRSFGFLGLSILAALIITAIFYFFSKAAKLDFFAQAIIFPILLYLQKPFFEVSFRGQLLSLLSTGILFYLLSEFETGKRKKIFLTIPLFVLWSNFHGQFLLGLGLFFLWTVLYLFKQILTGKYQVIKKEIIDSGKLLFFCLVCSIIATTVNPFGTGVLLESLHHFGNPLQRYIVEWIPFERFSILWWNLVFCSLFIFASIMIIYVQKKWKSNIHYIIITLILLILSFYVRRYSWSMLMISIPVISHLVSFMKPKLAEVSHTIAVIILIFLYLYIALVKAPQENVVSMNWDRYCYQYVGCSPKSAEFLKNQKYQGKMLTFYNWGGWLIWKYPEVKPSIDGRMHLWRDSQGYSAFEVYYPFEQNWKDINMSDYEIVYMTPKKPMYRKILELVNDGKWEIAYKDDNAAVFVRKKT